MPRSPGALDIFVGERIAGRRLALGLSQGALAQRLGVSFQQVQKYESGTNRVSAGRLHAMARALAMPLTDFFPPAPELPDPDQNASLAALARLMTATPEGRAVMMGFGSIQELPVRQAVATLVSTLGRAV